MSAASTPSLPAQIARRQPGRDSGDGIFKPGRKVNKFATRNASGGGVASPGNAASGAVASGSQGSNAGQPSSTLTGTTMNPKSSSSNTLPTPRSITPLPSRITNGASGSRPGTPSRSRPSGSTPTPQPTPPKPVVEYPIKLLPRLSSRNPATTTDPVLRALPFPTSLNILHIRHPPSSTVPLPDLLAPHPTPIHLNRKDPAAPPPPDPAIVAARNAERDLIAQIKTPIRQPDGTWKVRLWDWNNKCEKKDEEGVVVWKEAKDPALFAPDLGDGAASAANTKKWKFKSKFGGNKRGGGSFGGRGGGGRGGALKQGEVRTNVKMREQGLLYRSAGKGGELRIDLPDETESEDEKPVPAATAEGVTDEAPDEQATSGKKSSKSKGKKSAALINDDDIDPIDTSIDINSTPQPPPGKLNKKAKTYRRAAALANIRNREKLPLVLEGEFGHPLREPRPIYSTPTGMSASGARRFGAPQAAAATPGSAGGTGSGVTPKVEPNAAGTDGGAAPAEAEPTPEPPAPNRYVSHSISSTSDHYLALIFSGTEIGLRWVGREYEFGLRVDDMAKERERAALESMGRRGRGRWAGRGGAGRSGQARTAGLPGAIQTVEGGEQGEVVEGDVDMELYRPGSAADVKPSIDTGDNPDAFPRMLSSSDVKPRIKSDPDDRERGGRGRGRDTKPLMSLQDKLKVFEQAEYGYAPSGSGRAIDEDALERRGRGRGRATRIKFEDDDDELGGRRRAVGRSDVERGADEHWDVEDVGEQDDEEEVHVNADDEREARERGAVLSGEYHMANANVGLLQRDDVEDSDSDDLSPDRAEARKREKKRERRLKRKLAGAKESDTESETEEESSESSSEESEVEEEEDVKPDISALNAASATTAPTASPTKDKSRQRSASPSSRAARSPAPPVKREASPAGSFGRATSVDRGAGHVLAARRAISPAGQRGSVEPGAAARNSKKRKAPPMQSTAPPESGGSRQSTPVSKKARANTEGPSPTNSGPGTPAAVDYAMQELDAPVVSGSGGPATAEMGHTPVAAKKHKARGKKTKTLGEAGGDSPSTARSGSMTSDRFGSPGPSSSRQGSPAPSASRRPMSKGPKKESTPPQDIEGEKAKLRMQTFPGALTAKHVHDVLRGGVQLQAGQLFQALKPVLSSDSISLDQQSENQKRLKNICNWFCNKIRQEDGKPAYAWAPAERYE